MTEYGWTDRQKEEYQRLTDEYYAHPICARCGKPLDKSALNKDHIFPTEQGVGMEICCADCGPVYQCSWGHFTIAMLALEGESLQERLNMIWLNYADLLAKKAHPDWWDFTVLKTVRKEIEGEE